jgi:hypothetical protein
MKKKLAPSKKRKTGRPSIYNSEFHPVKAAELCLMGKTNPEIAYAFNIGVTTFKNWMRDYPEFMAAVKGGKDQADAVVVKNLYRRACGYKVQEKRVVKNPDGTTRMEIVEKEIAPDPTSMIFWLRNRQSKDWREQSRTVELKGTMVHVPAPASTFSPEMLKKMGDFIAREDGKNHD